MSSVSYSFKIDQSKINKLEANVMVGIEKMGMDIANQAQRNAPVLTGALVNSIRKEDTGPTSVAVIAGGKYGGYEVPYARMREYVNPAHPSTTHYLERAFDSVTKNWQKYFKGVTS